MIFWGRDEIGVVDLGKSHFGGICRDFKWEKRPFGLRDFF